MPVDSTWDNKEHTVIRQVFYGLIDWPTIEDLLDTAGEMLDTVQHRVDILALLKDAQIDNRLVRQLSQVAGSDFWRRPNLGYLVVVGANPIVGTVISLYMTLYPAHGRRVVVAPSVEDAYKLLDERSLNGIGLLV